MLEKDVQASRDWVSSYRSFALAWGLPTGTLIAGALVDSSSRTAIWAAALAWMGVACVMNAWRCGRTHCRFTGPFYLLLIIPVALHGSGLLPLGPQGWWILGAVILFGGRIIWWATEAAWGKFSATQ